MMNTPHQGTGPHNAGVVSDFDTVPNRDETIGDWGASLTKLLVSAFQEVDTDRGHAETLISGASSLLRPRIERSFSSPARDAVPGGLSAWQVQRLIEFIDKCLDQPLLLEDLSKTIGLSAGHFSRAFRRSFGISPHAYVVRRRVERACHLILTSDLSSGEVCGSQESLSYVSKLIEALRSRYQSEPQQARAPTPTVTSAISEPLSARECGILRLIAEGLSNKEIARNLSIAPETVKSHVKHIFIKLNVEKRAQAVSRAQILGLVGIQSQDCAARPLEGGYRLQNKLHVE